jgi:hypothetical protein
VPSDEFLPVELSGEELTMILTGLDGWSAPKARPEKAKKPMASHDLKTTACMAKLHHLLIENHSFAIG